MKQNIIYHNADLDGFCSAAIVKMHLIESGVEPKDINMIGWDYGHPSPLEGLEDRVFLVDISLEQSDMKLLACDPDTVWFDHHKSAIELSKKGKWDCISGERRIGDSAALITWQALFPNEKVPDIVYWVDRYDVWKKEDGLDWGVVLSIQLGMKLSLKDPSDPHAYDVWDSYINHMPSHIVYNGDILYQYVQDQNVIKAKLAFDLMFEGYNFCAINTKGNSEIAKSAVRSDHDGIMLFAYDGALDNWTVSLYGTGIEERGPVDLSVIAMRYGGGGHAGACGFKIDDIGRLLAGKEN